MAQIAQSTKSTPANSTSSGLIIGKFLPPHLGHQYLIDFARNYVDKLTVLVCSLKSEPIPGELRYKWMKKLFPDVNIIHVTDENPQEPKDHPDFWEIWKKSISKVLPKGADCLFASEDYGWKLAEILNMKYIPVNHPRNLVPISGTKIRENPIKYWEYLPPAIRTYFVKRVCIFGPESTGKTTLAKNLASHFNTVYAEEYARGLLDFKNGKCDYEDIEDIAKGHAASEEALSTQANKVLFSDTDLITTKIWSNVLFKKCPKWIEKDIDNHQYDLYLLMDIDVPYIEDAQRYFPNKRQWFLNLCIKALEKRGRKYVLISGSWKERYDKAVAEVEKLLKQ